MKKLKLYVKQNAVTLRRIDKANDILDQMLKGQLNDIQEAWHKLNRSVIDRAKRKNKPITNNDMAPVTHYVDSVTFDSMVKILKPVMSVKDKTFDVYVDFINIKGLIRLITIKAKK